MWKKYLTSILATTTSKLVTENIRTRPQKVVRSVIPKILKLKVLLIVTVIVSKQVSAEGSNRYFSELTLNALTRKKPVTGSSNKCSSFS